MAGHIAIVISEGTINIPNNTSPVTVNVYYYGNGQSYNNDACSGTIYIDGTPYNFSHKFTTSTSAQWLGSATKTVNHGADGKKTVSCSARFVTNVSLGTLTASGSKELTTIPRVSDLAVDVATVPADGTTQVIATAVKKSSSFTDTLKVTLGTYSQDITSGAAFTIPAEWINAIRGTLAVAKVTVTTKSGETTIGTKSVDLTVTVPASVVPTVTSVTLQEAVAAVTNAFGNRWVQNLSRIMATIVAEGAYGSTITSYSTSVDGIYYGGANFTSNELLAVGLVSVTTIVTDSRGRTASHTETINVIAYTLPDISKFEIYQCDSAGNRNSQGTYLKVLINGAVSSVDSQNTKALKIKYKAQSDTVYAEQTVALSGWNFETSTILAAIDPSVTFEIVAVLTDKIKSDSKSDKTGKIAMSFYATGEGATFFGEAEQDGLWVNNGTSKMRLSFTAAELAELNQLVGGGVVHLLDAVYPVGHILQTTNADYNPNELFSWMTWELTETGQGGVEERKLLWTNPSPASNFAAQSVTKDLQGNVLNLSDYDHVDIYTRSLTDSDQTTHTCVRIGETGSMNGTIFYYRYRLVTVQNNYIEFKNGGTFNGWASSAVTDNSGTIPLAVYGIRTLFDGQTTYYWKRTA